ncbi:MAG: multicopper oxidase family protein, partial [Gemmatimonadales bacterium]
MKPPDFLEFATGIVGLSAEELEGLDHASHGGPDSLGWTTVPRVPGFAMLPAEMLLRPETAAELPRSDAAPMALPSGIVALDSGDTLSLVAGAVRKRIHGREHTMLAFNGQVPGPLLKVERGSEVVIRFENHLEQPSTVHWHGVRLNAAMDGVPGLSQEPVPPGGRFDYTVRFPDAGLYWYHPHVRESMQQDLGLSGNIMVRGLQGLPVVAREEILLLDDILIGEHGLVPYGRGAATHALMGRFGNTFLINGEPRWKTSAHPGETLRLWFTNAANTRTFNLSVSGAAHRLVATDLGAFARPIAVESVVLGPAERYAVDVKLDGAGPWALVNRVRAVDHLYGRFVQQVDTLGVIEPLAGEPSPPPVEVPAMDSSITDGGLADSALEPDLVLEFG